VLKRQIEPYVRKQLEQEFGQSFEKQFLPIGRRADGSQATHEFDAVSADGRIVVGIKSSSGKTRGGKRPSGKIAGAYKELYFLSLVNAERRILVLTDPEFYRIFQSDCDGKLATGLELILIPLPPELEKRVQAMREAASQEMSAPTRKAGSDRTEV
jgi:hypothetical protein